MTEQSRWYAPAPSALPSTRLTLDMGLRSADLFFRDRVVPGLGRVWFVRQLSWPLAALALHARLAAMGERRYRPATLCHGLEALGCKLQFADDRDSDRVLGHRAFGRDTGSEIWDLARLSRPTAYVQNTHRQAATRALRVDGGLGLASGSRFDAMQLEPPGSALAKAFLRQTVGQGGTTLENWLLSWIRTGKTIPRDPRTLRKALSPDSPSRDERALVRARLLDVAGEAGSIRRRLAGALGKARAFRDDVEGIVVPRLRKAGADAQARDVLAARAFGGMLDRARDSVARMTVLVEPSREGLPITTLAKDPELARTLAELRAAAKRFQTRAASAGISEPESAAFATAQAGAQPDRAIRHLVEKSGQVLARSGSCIVRGTRFKAIGDASETEAPEERGQSAASLEPDRTGRTFRMANLHALLADIRLEQA